MRRIVLALTGRAITGCETALGTGASKRLRHRRLRLTRFMSVVVLATVVAGCSSSSPGGKKTATTVAASSSVSSRASGSPPTQAEDRIVFQGPGAGPHGSLALVRPDGSDVHPLFADSTLDAYHPDWSPDGDSLVYVAEEGDGTIDIWITNRDGREQRRLIDCESPCTDADDPAWSPDGTTIAYWTNGPTEDTQIVRLANATTGDVVSTIQAPSLWAPIRPRWSPDGQRLVVDVQKFSPDFRQTGNAIGIIDLADPDPSINLITSFKLLAQYADWSPTGDRIVFQAGNLDPFTYSGAPTNLFTINPDGSNQIQITDLGPGDAWIALPDWSTGDHPIRITLIHDSSSYTLGAVTDDGGDVVDMNVEGAHPRTFVAAPT